MINILFRCDGSVEIGMGHVIRCLALADELHENHHGNIYFAMRQSELGINKVKEKYPVIEATLEMFDYKRWLEDCIHKTNSHVLILDVRDGLNPQDLKQIKINTGVRVVTIDDPEDKRLAADLAFYPPVPQLKKMNWNGFKGKLYSGWEYVILRKEFSSKYPKPNNPIPNILISMGGTDENNMTEFVVDALDSLEGAFSVNIILGLGYQLKTQLENRLKLVRYKYLLYVDPNNVAKIMAQSDLAIISFGVTAYELAALNVPSFYLCLTEDHSISSKLFTENGLGVLLGLAKSFNKELIIMTISNYLINPNLFSQMRKNAESIRVSDLGKIASIIRGVI